MSRSHGAGQPLFFRCAMCRRARSWDPSYGGERPQLSGVLSHVALTSRRRYRFTGNGGRVDSSYQYEYRCLDCNHVGWSRHIEIAQKWAELLYWYVEVVEDSSSEVVKKLGPYTHAKASKLEDGVARNLNHDRYSTRIVYDA